MSRLSLRVPPFSREREQKPHFSQPGTFEFEYVCRWKALHEIDKQQRQLVDKNIREAKEKLEAELESAKNEHQLMLMTQGQPGFYFRPLSLPASTAFCSYILA